MPRSPADNQQIKDARREDILAAATRVFAKKGFTDAKISDVAKEAGLSHGLVYHYFANKEAVFTAILEDKLAHAREAMAEDDSLPGTALDRMRATLERWVTRVQAEPEMQLVITQAMVNDTLAPEVRNKMRAHMRDSYRHAAARIAKGQETGEIGDHASAEELATCMMCFMRGLAITAITDAGVRFALPSADTLMRVLLPASAIQALAEGSNVHPVRRAIGASPRSREAARLVRAGARSKKTERKASSR